MSELTNGKWNLPASAKGVLAPPATHAHPHRTDDAVVGITVLSVLALPLVVWETMRANRRQSSRTLRSFLRGHRFPAH